MAIKGKGKTRSRRVIAAPPRPQLVVRKKPVLARRSTWIAVGAVLLAGILVAVFIGVSNLMDSRKLDRQAAAVQQYVNLITAQLPATAQPTGPTSWNLFPDLDQRMADLDSGDLSASDAREEAASHPSDPQAWRDLSTALQTEGDTAGAIDALNRAIALRPKATDTYRELAGLHLTRASEYQQQLQQAQIAAAFRAPGTAFPSLTTKSGQATLTDPLQNAISTGVTNDVKKRKSLRLAAPIASPEADGCMWMMSVPMATCTVTGTFSRAAAHNTLSRLQDGCRSAR